MVFRYKDRRTFCRGGTPRQGTFLCSQLRDYGSFVPDPETNNRKGIETHCSLCGWRWRMPNREMLR
jgi:hypothetical protein